MTNDLISRSELLAEIDQERKRHIDSGNYGAEHLMVHSLRRLVEDAPAVDAAPVVHSKWVWIPDEEEDNTWHLVCDACRHGGLFEDDNYCHYCGAKMDKEAENAQE